MNLRKIVILILSCITLYSSQPVLAESLDIKGHWAYKEISKWEEKKLIEGYEDQTFKPDNNITRAEFFTLINRILGFTNQAQINYTDVSTNDWFANEIAKAQAAGYIDGYGDNTIRPNNLISRQEAAVIIYKLLHLNAPTSLDILSKFDDASSISDWSRQYFASVVENGYIDGYPDRTCRPVNNITRAESVALLDRVFGEGIIKNTKTSESNVNSEQKPGEAKQQQNTTPTEDKNITQPREKENPVPEVQQALAPSITGYVLSEGSTPGSIAIKYTAGKGNSLRYIRQTYAFIIPVIGMDIGSTGTIYTSGSDITGSVSGEHIGLYEVDSNNKVVKFADIILGSADVAEQKLDAPVLAGCTLSPGSMPGSVKLNYIPETGDLLRYVKQIEAFDTPKVGQDASLIGSVYKLGSDIINATAGERIGLYEVDSSNKVVKFVVILINSNDIASSESAGLTNLELSGNPANFLFTKEATEYYGVMVANESASITVTPTGSGIIKVNGEQVASGTASSPIALTEGVEKEIIVILVENGITQKTYTIKVTRQLAVSSDLANLIISGNPDNFLFKPQKYEYNDVTVANSVGSITITPTGNGKIIINKDKEVVSGSASSPIELVPGTVKEVSITIAEEGKQVKVYTIEITRKAN